MQRVMSIFVVFIIMTSLIDVPRISAVAILSSPSPVYSSCPPGTPPECVCNSSSIVCSDMGERSFFPTFPNASGVSYASLSFAGRTKIRTIQPLALNGQQIDNLSLQRLGIRSLQPNAFYGIANLNTVDASENNIQLIASGTFNVYFAFYSLLSQPVWMLNLSSNDIETIDANAFVPLANSLTQLDLSRNRLSNLPDALFQNLTQLLYLDLCVNQLSTISGRVFATLNGLESLLLAANRISYIDAFAFASLSSLQYLNLERNNLTVLPAGIFRNLLSLRTLSLYQNRLTYIRAASLVGLPVNLNTLNLSRNMFADLADVEISPTLSGVQWLSLAFNRISVIPVRYFSNFTALRGLDLSGNALTSVDNLTFSGLTSLANLNLRANRIDQLPADTFYNIPALQTLGISYNKLQTLEVDLFRKSSSLRSVNFRGNDIREVPPGIFQDLLSLTNIDLSQNSIYGLTNLTFNNLPALSKVDLSENYIEAVEYMTFRNIPSIQFIILDDNQLKTIDGDIFTNFPSLQNISVTNNKISELHAVGFRGIDVNLNGNNLSFITTGSFNRLTNNTMRYLHLSQNLLSAITGDIFAGLTNLLSLDLSDNIISSLEDGCFRDLSALTSLRLDGNQLTQLSANALIGMYSLRQLNLSRNQFSDVYAFDLRQLLLLESLLLDDNNIAIFNASVFRNLRGLTTLSLRNNQISRVMNINNNTFPYLRYLDIGNNNLSGDVFYDIRPLPVLETLKLDYNNISVVHTQVNFSTWSLVELDLSRNNLDSNVVAAVVTMTTLQILRLDNNVISNLSVGDWSPLSWSLSVLSLNDNQLTEFGEIAKLLSLTELHLHGNAIDSIPDNIFREMYGLKFLSLRANHISTIGPAALDGLESSCTYIDLAKNSINSVDAAAFNRLKCLRYLDVHENSLTSIVLPPIMIQLEELDLSGNQLDTFPTGLWQFNSIQVINLSTNQLSSVPFLDIYDEDSFHVNQVDFSYNQLSDTESIHFSGYFERISFKGNSLTNIDSVDVFMSAKNIDELDLSDNKMAVIPASIYLALSSVKCLDLSNNFLTDLNDWIVDPNLPTTIQKVYLCANQLREIPTEFLIAISASLTMLDLRDNQLEGINGSVFQDAELENLKNVNVELLLINNPWRCDCELSWLRLLPTGNVDNATCLTPLSVNGQFVFCFPVDNNCPRFYGNETVSPVCAEFRTPTDPNSPTVSGIWPDFGPQAGGTHITFTGQRLNVSSVPVAMFFYSQDEFTAVLSTDPSDGDPTYTSLVEITPEMNETGRELLTALQFYGGPTLSTNQSFVYRPNPVIQAIYPLTHLISGGTMVTVIGESINSAAVPVIIVTVVVTNVSATNSKLPRVATPNTANTTILLTSQECTVRNFSMMTCIMPTVDLPEDFKQLLNDSEPTAEAGPNMTSLVGRNGLDFANIYVGLVFDGYRKYDNLTSSFPEVSFRFFEPPTINNVGLIEYDASTDSTVDIKGSHLTRGCRLSDYRVSIGLSLCPGVDPLTDNVLLCLPPTREPQHSPNDTFCNSYNSILVHAGNAGPFLFACIDYVDSSSVNVLLIVGLTVGLGVPFLILIIVIIVVVCLHQRQRKRQQKNAVEMLTTSNEPSNYARVIPVGDVTDQQRQQLQASHSYIPLYTEYSELTLQDQQKPNDGYLVPSESSAASTLSTSATDHGGYLVPSDSSSDVEIGNGGYLVPAVNGGGSGFTNDGYLVPTLTHPNSNKQLSLQTAVSIHPEDYLKPVQSSTYKHEY